MKRFLLLAIVLSGCQASPTPKNTVDAYLEVLQKGKTQQQQELSCRRKDEVKSNDLLTNVEKWEVTEQETVTAKDDSDAKVEVVSAKVETKTIGGFSVTRTWKFAVWKSDDFFEARKRRADLLNQSAAKTDELVNRVNALAGQEPVEIRKPEVPQRSDYSSKLYCIWQFANES
ncbi:MAG: hypothetical protein LH660_19875 [Phormidesmis sp. CAN_BIN36]|nr:hypothetical protein [Phormidesmis sp. CAN_BIN36]